MLDGELVIPVGGALSFDALQLRLHPAESRIRKLAARDPGAADAVRPALLEGDELCRRAARPSAALRSRAFHAAEQHDDLLLSPCTRDRARRARPGSTQAGGALDGVVAKRRDEPYAPGERAMLKVKRDAHRRLRRRRLPLRRAAAARSARCCSASTTRTGCSTMSASPPSIPAAERAALTRRLEALVEPPGFTGDAPGGPSRWSTERTGDWQPLRPELVAEVRYDHVTGGRFRHGTKFLRWRPDKAPGQCRMDQLQPAARGRARWRPS